MRKILHYIVSFLVAALSLTSCASFYQITGASELLNTEGSMLYLVGTDGMQVMAVDSTNIEHGLFNMEGSVDSVRMVTLYIDNEGIMPIILEDGNIKVQISNSQLRASGTPLNDQLYKFIDERNVMARKINNLDRQASQLVVAGGISDNDRRSLMDKEREMTQELSDHTLNFIKKNYKNVLGPSVFMMITSTLPYPVMTDEIKQIVSEAPKEFLQNAYVKDYVEKAESNQKILDSQSQGRQIQQNQYYYDDGNVQFQIQETYEFRSYGPND